MKGKKAGVIAFMVIVLCAGWFMAAKEASGIDRIRVQNALAEEADMYAEKELYIRAIPLYQEALVYHTDQTAEIQKKLLSAYKAHGDLTEYASLVESRIADNTAEEAEYIAVADYYIASYKVESAMELIRKGIEQLGTQRLKDYYEENRYSYHIVTTNLEEIVPTETNELMPAFDGNNWIYVERDGRDADIGLFDSAVPFSAEGYGVVARNGTYYTILTNGDLYGVDELGVSDIYGVNGSRILARYHDKYSYYDYDFQSLTDGSHQYDAVTCHHDGVAAVKSGNKWGIIKDNGDIAVDFSLEDMAVNSLGSAFAGGNAMVKISGKWHLIDTEGNEMFEAGFSNGRAPESANGYIAVANEYGKWGYIDRNGQLMIDYQYDDAKSFSNSLGAVMLGETWFYISEKNVPIIDIGFQDAQPFHAGMAQAKITDGAVLIALDYYEE